jgi:phenylalanyl-tRNA synthetase beta chain
MNILVPDSWLREFLKTKAAPKQIAEALSLHSASVEKLEEVDDDTIYEIEITTNRVDMASIKGIAREAAAAITRLGISAKYVAPEIKPPNKSKNDLPLEIINNPDLCSRIMAVVLDGVEIAVSPEKIRRRLEASGLRSLNNAVDITNYIMLETGHPTHVFDYDRIETKRLVIRRSKRGEKIVTLDNKEYFLAGGDIVIDDGSGKIIDLPGIIGAANSVVVPETKRLIFFIENNDAHQIRKTSMKLGIRTYAAMINDKGPDPNLVEEALIRGIRLYQDLLGAKIAGEIVDIYPKPNRPKRVALEKHLVDSYLDQELAVNEIEKTLSPLGFKVSFSEKRSTFNITVPSWRTNDINIAEDVIEEIVRLYGYHKIKTKLPPLTRLPPGENYHLYYWQDEVRNLLKHEGYRETYTYSLVGKAALEEYGFDLNPVLKLENPLNRETEYLRPSLVPSLLSVIKENRGRGRGEEKLKFFEIANVYLSPPDKKRLPAAELHLTIVTTAEILTLKSTVELILKSLHTDSYRFEQKKATEAAIFIGEIMVGRLEQIGAAATADFDFAKLISTARNFRAYVPVSEFPPLIEDMTFAFPQKTLIGPVINAIRKQSDFVERVKIQDEYKNNITFRVVYRSRRRSLGSEDIKPIREKIAKDITVKFKAEFKG